MRYVILSLFISLSTFSWSQKKSVLKKITTEFESGLEWCTGSVQFREDQKIVNGSIQYSEKLQTLRFNNNESTEFLSANSVMKFYFFDKALQKERTFISLDYPLNEDFIKRDGFPSLSLNELQDERTVAVFFELLAETKSFVALKRISPLEILEPDMQIFNNRIPTNPTGGDNSSFDRDRRVNNSRNPAYGQVITIYFLDFEGNVFPYFRGTRIEKKNSSKIVDNSRFFGDRYNSELDIKLGENLLRKKMMRDHFPTIKEFITSNKLDCNEIEDLLKIIEFYKTLEE